MALEKKRVHWFETNSDTGEVIADKDVDIYTSADAVTCADGETVQEKLDNSVAQKSDIGLLNGLKTTDKSSLVSAINEVKDEVATQNTYDEKDLDKKAEADGSNATGEWGIDITGNAKTATKATSADKLNTNAGSATNPTYFEDGIPKACTYKLEKSVPAGAVFTDTKYSVPSIGMVDLGFTVGSTCTVYEFFTKIYEKGLDKIISLHLRYDNTANAKISDGTTTIDVSGVSCFISIYGDVNSTWKKNYALLSVQNKMYLLYCIHSGNATSPSSQGIVDVTTMKATQDGAGNVITDTYLPLKGGTMNKGASIIVPYTVNDDRYIEITGHTIMNYLPSNTGYAGGLNWYDQSNNVLGSIGLYGSKGIPEYYYVGDYSDPFVKVDMEGNTIIKKNLNGLTTLFVQKSDATGYPSYLLAFDITDWFLNGSHSKRGFNGHVYSDRSGGYMGQEEVAIVIMDCGYTKATTIGQTLRLTTNNGNYRPCMIHDTVNDKYYLALKISGQDRSLYFHGKVSGTMSTTQIKATDGSGTLPTGYEFVFDPANCTMGMGVSSHSVRDASGNVITDTYAKKSIYGDTAISIGRQEGSTVGVNSAAFGEYTIASGSGSLAHGYGAVASGTMGCYASGYDSVASGRASHAEGENAIASGQFAHAEGGYTTASGSSSHAEGYKTTALNYQHAQGHFNNTNTATANETSGTSSGTAFVIGNGTASSASNAFRITGKGVIYATNATVQTGADYAEYFEWSDGNPNEEDRVGYFVTFDEDNPEKIRIASKDDYILGIVSGMPNIIGNGDECWKQRYILDDFGRYIEETFEYEVEVAEVVEKEVEDEETGETKIVEEVVIHKETKIGTKWKENPEYDPTKPYIPRDERAEWSTIGMLGVLSVRDDGTCQVNGYCKCTDGGIATACEKEIGAYRVIKRVTDNIVKVVLK